MEDFNVYKDINARTNGEIYIGVVGPVRTGKSTFIKRFMEKMVLPNIVDENDKEIAQDEMPQSASGRTIMTTEPKFIPKDGVDIRIDDNINMKVRLIDCVGYVVAGAEGQMEDGKDRMVKTPWYDYDIPFAKAAEIGTKKVINNHSTVGIVVTCDGSFGELERESYIEAENRTVNELKELGKPFVMLLNSNHPYDSETKNLAKELSDKYKVSVIPVNCDQMTNEDINGIFRELLYSFPVASINFIIPKWLEVCDDDNYIKQSVIRDAIDILNSNRFLYDIKNMEYPDNQYVESYSCGKLNLADGTIDISVVIYNNYYYEMISDMMGTSIHNEYDFINEIKSMSKTRKMCDSVMNALQSVKGNGYGLVMPERNDISLDEPELIKAGNKYGVKVVAKAPSVHMIKADITTEIAPIVGSKEQAEDLIEYIRDSTKVEGKDIWEVNIFGKSVEQLVEDGLNAKANRINSESQQKLQDAMKKIVNDGNGGMVCIII